MGYSHISLLLATQIAYESLKQKFIEKNITAKQMFESRIHYSKNYEVMKEWQKFYEKLQECSPEALEWTVADYIHLTHGTGLFACVIDTKDGNAIIAFRGSESQSFDVIKKTWIDADLGLFNATETAMQKSAVDYVNDVYDRFHDQFQHFTTVGHSLGGNLAEHVLLKCKPEMYDVMDAAYNMDGPGYSNKYMLVNGKAIKERKKKIHHYGWSWVGDLLAPIPDTFKKVDAHDDRTGQKIEDDEDSDLVSIFNFMAEHKIASKLMTIIKNNSTELELLYSTINNVGAFLYRHHVRNVHIDVVGDFIEVGQLLNPLHAVKVIDQAAYEGDQLMQVIQPAETLEYVIGNVQNVGEQSTEFIADAAINAGNAMTDGAQFVQKQVGNAIESTGKAIGDATNTATKTVNEISSKAEKAASQLANDTAKATEKAAHNTVKSVNKTVKAGSKAANKLATDTAKAAKKTQKDASKAVKKTQKNASKAINQAGKAINKSANDAQKSINKALKKMPKLPF